MITITAADFAEHVPYFTFPIGACGQSLTQINFSKGHKNPISG